MTAKTFLLTAAEFAAAEERRMQLARTRTDGHQGAGLREVLDAGAMWFVPWYFDPTDRVDMAQRRTRILDNLAARGEHRDYLSKFYWQDWSDKRPPICVLCPGGGEWCIDAKSNNGDGWRVTGEPPKITATPSILLPNYHGFLKDGLFTPDLDAATRGRAP